MKRNPFQNIIGFVVRYIWILCAVLVTLELCSTLISANLLLKQTSNAVLQAQMGEISGRVDGVLRLLNGFANDDVIGDTSLPLFDRATHMRAYQGSYDLFMLALLDREFNVVSSDETEPPNEPFSLASRDYLQRMKETGTYQITDAMVAGSDHVTKNYTIAVPLFRDGVLDGGVFGSIYFDDIEKMMQRENKGDFYLLGRENTIMAGGTKQEQGQSLQGLYKGLYIVGKDDKTLDAHMKEHSSGDFWVFGSMGPAYITYGNVGLTDWTLVYEARFDLVFPLVLPMLLVKVLLYGLLCWSISKFGRRYLEHRFSDVSHLLDQVTQMHRELFSSEQGDYNKLLDLTQQGLTDPLTGLATRGVFAARFAQWMGEASAAGLLCFLDLDDLKIINDSYGHEVGDRALVHFGEVLKRYEEVHHGIAARYGGDEFLLTIDGMDETQSERLVETLCRDLRATLQMDMGSVSIHGSVGVAFYPTHGTSLEELISKADLALYAAKRNGKNGYEIFMLTP